MARRSSARTMTVYRPQAAAPITIRVPRAPSAPRKKSRRRGRSRSGLGGGGGILTYAVGGAAFGFIEKSEILKDVPAFPMIGKKGTITAIAYFWAKNGGPKIAWDVARAGAVLSGYEFGKEGKISGDDEADYG